MFSIPSLYLKLIGAAIVLGALGLHLWSDNRVKKSLADVQTELIRVTEERRVLETELIALTKSKETLDIQLKIADEARAKIRADLDATLKKLRVKKPPTECKAAIEWSITNKGDLAW